MSETAKRILSGLTLGGLVVAALSLDIGVWFFTLLLVLLFSILGVLEYYKLADRGFEGRPIRFLGIIFTVLIVLAFYAAFLKTQVQRPQDWMPSFYLAFANLFYPGRLIVLELFTVFLLLAMAIHLLARPLDGPIFSVSTTITGVLYACVTISHAFLIFAMKYGIFYFVLFAVITIGTDTGAYFAGKYFGKHNAGLKVSPKKTYEGYFGGFAFALIISCGFLWGWKSYAFEHIRDIPMSYAEAAVLGVVFSAISIFGDLVESALKRDAKIKDSASLIPGHGGILDLVDALLFTTPIGFYYLATKAHFGFPV